MAVPGDDPDGPREEGPDGSSLIETVARTAPIVLFELDADGVFTRSEGRGLDALGLEPDEVVGESVFDVYADAPDIVDAVERALAGEAVHTIHRVNGSAFEVWYTPSGTGRPVGVQGVGLDVTDRARYERRLEQLNDASRDLHEASTARAIAERAVSIAADVLEQPYAGVWFHDADGDELVSVAGNGPARTHVRGEARMATGSVEMATFRGGESRLIEDYGAVENAAFPDAPVGTVLLFPIGSHGLLSVASPSVVEVDDTERDLIEILARDVEVALDRTERERLLERLNEATRELAVADSAPAVADCIVRINRRVLDEPATAVWLYDPDDDVLEPVSGVNESGEAGQAPTLATALDPIRPGTAEMEAFRRGETAFFEDYHALTNPAHPETRLGAIFATPIGEYGLLTVGAPTAGEIGSSTPDLVEILARDGAVALDRVKRESAVERLHAATRALIEAGTREEIAAQTVAAAEEILDHPRSVFRLVAEDGRTLEPVAMTDWIQETIPDRPAIGVGEGPIGTAFQRGESMHFDRDDLSEVMGETSTDSVLCMPVGEYGVLTIGVPESGSFVEADRRLAMILTTNARTALDRIDRELELERQNERLESFAGIVTHDLRNPLNVITGHLELAREDPSHFAPIADAVDRMAAIIDDVLALSREGGAVAEPEPVALDALAGLAWGVVDSGEASLAVDADRRILADPDRLRRLLENLFRNAVEHAGERPTVQLGTTDAGFFVEDDGPGFPADGRDRLFEMGVSAGAGGTGLGLAIVDEIAASHGWSVAVADGADGGARIEITRVEWADGDPRPDGAKGNG